MLDELLELELDEEELDDELLLELDEELLELDDEELLELELDEELLDDEELDDELLLELDEELLELDDEELLELELDEELLDDEELDDELLLELDEEELDKEKLLYPSSAGPTRSAPAYVQAASCVIPAPNTPPASSRRNARRSSWWPTSEPEARFVVESCMLDFSLDLLAPSRIAVGLFQRQMNGGSVSSGG